MLILCELSQQRPRRTTRKKIRYDYDNDNIDDIYEGAEDDEEDEEDEEAEPRYACPLLFSYCSPSKRPRSVCVW